MIRVNIAGVLKEHKPDKSLYWLARETGVSYPTIHRLATKPVRKVDLDIVEKICRTVGCRVEELLVMRDR